jgi:molybdopterin-guanine dinucleotide biosynthesis protein A
MKVPFPAAVLAGGASRRMGVSKAALPYGPTTLLAHQTSRLSEIFEKVYVVAKRAPEFDAGPGGLLLDRSDEHAAIHGVARALEEAADRVFVLGVDLPLATDPVLRAIAERSLEGDAAAVVPRADGRLQPLAAVWRRRLLPEVLDRIARGNLSLHALLEEARAEIFDEADWKALDPSGNSFANVNTVEQYVAARGSA